MGAVDDDDASALGLGVEDEVGDVVPLEGVGDEGQVVARVSPERKAETTRPRSGWPAADTTAVGAVEAPKRTVTARERAVRAKRWGRV